MHPEILLPAKQPVSSWVWNECCTLSSAAPLSTSPQPLLLPGKGSEITHGFGWMLMSTEDAMNTWNRMDPCPQGPGQLAAPELLCQPSKSLCESRGRQEHLDIHVVDKAAWSFLLGCQATVSEETRRNWNARCLHNVLLITNVSFACGKGAGQPAPPKRENKKEEKPWLSAAWRWCMLATTKFLIMFTEDLHSEESHQGT